MVNVGNEREAQFRVARLLSQAWSKTPAGSRGKDRCLLGRAVFAEEQQEARSPNMINQAERRTQSGCHAYESQRLRRLPPTRVAYRVLCLALSFTYFPISNAVG